MNIKYLIAFFCFFLFLNGFGQNSKISITSSSGNIFLLMNNISQNSTKSDSIHINNLPEGSYHIKVINIDSIVSAEKTIYLNSNQHQQLGKIQSNNPQHFCPGTLCFQLPWPSCSVQLQAWDRL